MFFNKQMGGKLSEEGAGRRNIFLVGPTLFMLSFFPLKIVGFLPNDSSLVLPDTLMTLR